MKPSPSPLPTWSQAAKMLVGLLGYKICIWFSDAKGGVVWLPTPPGTAALSSAVIWGIDLPIDS